MEKPICKSSHLGFTDTYNVSKRVRRELHFEHSKLAVTASYFPIHLIQMETTLIHRYTSYNTIF